MAFFLTCGELTSATCTLEDYVIEWRRNSLTGPVEFVTANSGNTDVGIDAFHPIVDEVVLAGTLFPVIRYVVLDGEKYTSEDNGTDRFSPDLNNCIPNFIIDPIGCNASNFTPSETLPYDFRISRDVGIGSKDREFSFSISQTSNFFAFAINSDIIADAIEIYYCTASDSTGTFIDHLVVGSGITSVPNPVNYPTEPIVINASRFTNVKYVSDLRPFAYASGDYLRIKVVGNYFNPTEDSTKWIVYMRCLDSLGPLPSATQLFTKTGPTTAVYNTVSCAYDFEYETAAPFQPSTNYFKQSDLYKYFYNILLFGGLNQTATGNKVTHNWNEVLQYSGGGNTSCFGFSGTVTVTKTGNQVVFDYTDNADYSRLVADYNAVINNSKYQPALNANPVTDPEFYAYYQIGVYKTLGRCDTTVSREFLEISISAVWTFDAVALTATVNLIPMTYQLQEYGLCNSWNEQSQSVVTNISDTIALPDFSYTSEKSNVTFLAGFFPQKTFPQSTNIDTYRVALIKSMLNGIYSPSNSQGYVDGTTEWYAFIGNDRTEFTDPSTPATRLATWQLYRQRFFTTLNQADFGIYDLIDSAP